MGYRETLDFYLSDWLGVDALTARERFVEHSTDTFAAVFDLCERVAEDKFAPFNRLADTEEPRFDGEKVILPEATHEAARAYVATGLLAAAQDHDIGGMQLPCVIEMAANSFFSKASIGLGGGAMLTSGNANLLMAHGTPLQQEVFARQEFSGRFFGTMCLSEPQAGSSLSDIVTRASPDGPDFERDPLGPRYRLRGSKMWISNGEHELAENIVHLVLAKVPDETGQLVPGTKGISLFIVPKHLVGTDGQLTGERNDVALAGLNHKLGYRGIPNTLLNFGEGKYPVRSSSGGALSEAGAGAIGYRVGPVGDGLQAMFHMMNEARIAVGMGATMLGYAGYEASLAYARERPQGRPMGVGGKDPCQPQVPIIRHADVRRMLLAQKAYCEGGLALGLYCARLVDDVHTGTEEQAEKAAQLLDVLTPIAKSWPSEWCLEANSLAIQVFGGYGYTRDYPVEQYWRDNRLNMIHEGTHGIQGLDLLGRKVRLNGGCAFGQLTARIQTTIERARSEPAWAKEASELANALAALRDATEKAWETGLPEDALINATPYLQGFGHTVLAWLWLDIAVHAQHALAQGRGRVSQLNGKLAAARYFFAYELPRAPAWLGVVARREAVCRDLGDEDF